MPVDVELVFGDDPNVILTERFRADGRSNSCGTAPPFTKSRDQGRRPPACVQPPRILGSVTLHVPPGLRGRGVVDALVAAQAYRIGICRVVAAFSFAAGVSS